MRYDSSKTLSENKEIILEYVNNGMSFMKSEFEKNIRIVDSYYD